MFRVMCVQIRDDLQLVPCSPEEAVEASRHPEARVWIDLPGMDADEFAEWLDKLGIQGFMRRLCLESGDHSGIFPSREEMLLVIPVLSDVEGTMRTDFAGLLCRENLLLSWHAGHVLRPKGQAPLQDSKAWLDNRSTAAIVAALFMDLSSQGSQRTAGLRDAVRKVEVRMELDPDSVDSDEILDLRSALLEQETVISDQLPPLRTLSMTDRPYFRLENARDYMNSTLTNVEASDRALARLETRVDALLQAYQMNSQEQTNRRLGMLTILSALFMPITLMAGIWGMNFEGMPELAWPHGYPMALGAMVLVAGGMFLFFRRGGWFG